MPSVALHVVEFTFSGGFDSFRAHHVFRFFRRLTGQFVKGPDVPSNLGALRWQSVRTSSASAIFEVVSQVTKLQSKCDLLGSSPRIRVSRDFVVAGSPRLIDMFSLFDKAEFGGRQFVALPGPEYVKGRQQNDANK